MYEKYSAILIVGGLSMSAISYYLHIQNNKGKKLAIGSFIIGTLTTFSGIMMYLRKRV